VKNTLWRVLSYLKYYFKSSTAHGVHSPFVYDLLVNTIYNDSPFYIFGPIESLRLSFRNNSKIIEIQDYGAGSKYSTIKGRKVSEICRHSVKTKKYAQLIFRLAEKHKPNNIIELGTSLGITTLYLSYACSQSKIITVEGAENLAQFAKEQFNKFKRKNIEIKVGKFQDVIPSILNGEESFDFVFFDGHHDEHATINYFEQFISKASVGSIFIFDDIHWSKGMEKAWETIKSHEKVSLSLDLFEMGLLYFMPRNQKEHFLIRF